MTTWLLGTDACGAELPSAASVPPRPLINSEVLADGAERSVKGKTFFDLLDFITANVMMPLGGVFIAIFVGWFMSRESVAAEARVKSPLLFNIWRFMVRYISPVAIFIIFVEGLS